jgi:peroxiredoxin
MTGPLSNKVGEGLGVRSLFLFMATHLTEGQKAPAFTATDQNGTKISLADFKGGKVILYFYPEDDTPTCTIQACNLRDNYALLTKAGFQVIGVSPDDEMKHQKFIAKFSLPFTLVTDPQHTSLLNTVFGVRRTYMAASIWGCIAPRLSLMKRASSKRFFCGRKMQRIPRRFYQ